MSVMSNAFINSQIEQNKLTLNTEKCHKIYIGGKKVMCPKCVKSVTKSELGVPWRRFQNTQSMLFPCLFREYMGHISLLLWGTRHLSLMPPI